ncbi:hypothetical protein MP638_003852 [Amoeboaphelidium occidentale]|nr:hypothetical protein MP638_003852 [Amoeboaphelidium occidentale]
MTVVSFKYNAVRRCSVRSTSVLMLALSLISLTGTFMMLKEMEGPQNHDHDHKSAASVRQEYEDKWNNIRMSEGWNTSFCNKKNRDTYDIFKVQRNWGKEPPRGLSNAKRKLILDLSDFGSHPMLIAKMASRFKRLKDRASKTNKTIGYCNFPIPEWARIICSREKISLGLCDSKGRLPCYVFRNLLGEETRPSSANQIGPCDVSKNLLDITKASAVVVNAFSFKDLLDNYIVEDLYQIVKPAIRTKNDQLWAVFAAGESATYYPLSEDPDFLEHFDYSWGHDTRFYQTQINAYVPSSVKSLVSTKEVPFAKKKMAVYLASHCNAANGRDQLVKKLSKFMDIDSLGACIPMNSSSSIRHKDSRLKEWRTEKLKLISNYKFVLAFENSNCYSYVTEKLYDPFMAGTVPVYMGAPNVYDFAPSNSSLVKTSDFDSPQDLAKYLNLIASSEDLYKKFLSWRQMPLEDLKQTNLGKLIDHNTQQNPLRDICEMLNS